MKKDAIYLQSKNAYNQWKDLWRKNAKIHSRLAMKPLSDFENSGIGKAVLVIANGYSFEKNIDIIRENQHKVDILVCDKTLGACLDNGIMPTYCVMCDAKVDYEKYLKPWEDKLQDIVLFSNVCGNPQWTEEFTWKDRYFFVNKDVLGSEKEFTEISGCENHIPAGTNVSNAMVVFLTQSDNDARKNFFGYDKILLVGFDYCWLSDGKYYAFCEDGNGKSNYMRHLYLRTIDQDYCYTSNNLYFSAQWFEKYVRAFALPVVQCGNESIVSGPHRGDLLEQMDYNYKTMDSQSVRRLTSSLADRQKEMKLIKTEIARIAKDHYYSYRASL